MNAERLHIIAKAIQRDLGETKAVDLISQLSGNFQQLTQNPANVGAQQIVSSLRAQLEGNLANAPSNNFPPAWLQTLAEIGATDFLGSTLKKKIEEIFSRNGMTPGVAHQELGALQRDLVAFKTSVDQLVASLGNLHIGSEDLPPVKLNLEFLFRAAPLAMICRSSPMNSRNFVSS